ncbi:MULTISPECIES: VOC family protein [Ensifer]|uniref:Glyoxalase n=1 Tax=Ensifer canadensis TaxID=555315 RepID=A0AAW4FK20_9HYPH|nr:MULTISPECIES: VOC family protein [Ensifer]MDP9632324.1 putative lactoylglutathione lyase [Ensifer adhaerens]KQU74116.1 glyoxalase [Ensifer sp. Root31]KQW59037.1 glyoxalase [Ensifer sp. Root1252]KQW62542.1 glyoxalase [Ensifer sp. Root127]KQY79150.1 glyoxalase [Ensifer sp. Root142]
MRMIFVNLPVKDLKASRAFFAALGYTFNEQFSDDTAACTVISDNIFVMLLTEPKFRGFITGEISDASKGTEVITALSASSRAECDDMLAKALAAGAKPWKPALDYGFMYGISFQDLDGHVWEFMWMDMEAAQQQAS